MSSVSDGKLEKPVLVLLHGATGNGRMWAPVRRILESRGYRVLTPDLPGHGSRRAERFSLQAAVQAVVDAVASVEPAPVVVSGDSLGGYVTMAAAGSLPPAQLRGLVPSGCTLLFQGPALLPLRIKGLAFKLLAAVLGEKRLVGPRFVRELGKLGVSEADAHGIIEGGVNMAAFDDCVRALSGVNFPVMLSAAHVPVRLVNGGDDKQILRDRARYEAAVPRARHVIFPNTGHGVSLLRSQEFADVLDDFATQPV
jgi:pimeloyl-ACP methyl ester carboxylesterase